MFGTIVLEMPKQEFDRALERVKREAHVASDSQLSEAALDGLIRVFKELGLLRTGHAFPQDPLEQLAMAVNAVFQSWRSARAQSTGS